MVLLEMLYRHSHARQSRCGGLTVLHFNYHLRGGESDRDEEFVRNEATRRGVPVVVIDAPLTGKSGIQERAREMRRGKTMELALENGWNVVATGHQADDQLETLVMRMIRGAGSRGLKGMDVESELAPGLRLIRPLLGVSRETVLESARREGIPYVEDSSNKGGRYFRNRVRQLFLPQIKKENRHFAKTVTEECERYRRQYEADLQAADDFLAAHAGAVPIGRYFQLSDSVRFLVLESLLKRNGFSKEVNRCHVTEIETLMHRSTKSARVYGNAFFLAEEGTFSFIRG